MKNYVLILTLFLASLQSISTEAKTTYRYQEERECTKDQLHLEKQWTDFKITQRIEPENQDLHPQCMLYAMRNFEAWTKNRKYYAQCSSETSKEIRTQHGVCKTKNMVESLNLLYNHFTKCFNLSPKYFFLVISSESGFILNAFAPGLDIGLGQLTQPGINDVNFNWPQLTYPIETSSSPYCQEVKTWLRDLHASDQESENICAFVSTPKNPARNLLYSLLLHQQNRSYYTRLLEEPTISTQLTTLLKHSLSDFEKLQLIDSLSLLTYNMGYERLSALFRAYLVQNYRVIQDQQQKALTLREEIIALKAQLQPLSLAGEINKAKALRDKISSSENEYQNIFDMLREPILELEHLDPLKNTLGDKSFWAFLKSKKESHYVDLILGRASHVDGILGKGFCTETDNSNGIDPTKWL